MRNKDKFFGSTTITALSQFIQIGPRLACAKPPKLLVQKNSVISRSRMKVLQWPSTFPIISGNLERPSSMVTQVPIIGILMIVHGSLACIMGLLFMIIGPTIIVMEGNRNRNQNDDKVIAVVLLIFGGLILISGLFNIVAGIRAQKYRSRGFVLTALFLNVLSMCSYCFLTALGLMIYGLIVMFQSDVGRAFAMGEEGYSPDEIKRKFAYRRDRFDDDYDDDEDFRRDERRRERRPRSDPDDSGNDDR